MEALQIWVRSLESKKDIRHRVLEARKEIGPLKWQKATEGITAAVTSHMRFREATDIYCYVDHQGEAGTRLIIEEAWRLGKDVWVPRVLGRGMEFFHIENFGQLHPGTMGILEPEEGTLADGTDALVIMPGVAFDRDRRRIGYGGGYYDRYLAAHPCLPTMAVAFDCQVLDEVPYDEYDIRPQILVTETSVYENGK